MKGIGKFLAVAVALVLVAVVIPVPPAMAKGIDEYSANERRWFTTSCSMVRGEVEEHSLLRKAVPSELRKRASECVKWERDLAEYMKINYPKSYSRMR